MPEVGGDVDRSITEKKNGRGKKMSTKKNNKKAIAYCQDLRQSGLLGQIAVPLPLPRGDASMIAGG